MSALIPSKWWSYQQESGYVFMYHGDVYYGLLYPDTKKKQIVVIPNAKRREFFDRLNRGPKVNSEELAKFGWAIPDIRMIRTILPGNIELGRKDHDFGIIQGSARKTKRMYIFGAGASSHCVFGENQKSFHEFEWRPPLGNELLSIRFDDTLQKFDGVRNFLAIAEADTNGIESCMENEWKFISSSYNPQLIASHINIQLCLGHVFQQISNFTVSRHSRGNLYSNFADRLQKFISSNSDENVAVVSFNYDTILDQFIEAKTARYKKISDYVNIENRQILFFKPHGSCNWGWPFAQSDGLHGGDIFKLSRELYSSNADYHDLYYSKLGTPNEMIHYHSWGYETSLHPEGLGRFTISNSQIEIVDYTTSKSYYPALLLPYRDKDEFVMPHRHFYYMQSCMETIEELTIIGWKGSEARFTQLLKDHATNLKRIFIADPNFSEVAKVIRKALGGTSIQIQGSDSFEHFVKNHLDTQLFGG